METGYTSVKANALFSHFSNVNPKKMPFVYKAILNQAYGLFNDVLGYVHCKYITNSCN